MTEKERLAEQERVDNLKKEAEELRKEITQAKAETPVADQSKPEFQQELDKRQSRLSAIDEDIQKTEPLLLVPSNAETPMAGTRMSSDPPVATNRAAAVPPPNLALNPNQGKALDLEPDPDNPDGFRVKQNQEPAVASSASPPKSSAETAAPSAETGPKKDDKAPSIF